MSLSRLERAVLEHLVDGDGEDAQTLRGQLAGISVAGRTYSGMGFFVELATAPDAEALTPARDLSLGEVRATIPGLAYGAGFVLWVKAGLIDMLEGYTDGEPWPDDIDEFTLE